VISFNLSVHVFKLSICGEHIALDGGDAVAAAGRDKFFFEIFMSSFNNIPILINQIKYYKDTKSVSNNWLINSYLFNIQSYRKTSY